MRPRRLLMLAAVVPLLPAGSAAATLRPDLLASPPHLASTAVSAGGTLTVTDRVRNAGRATGSRSAAGLYLSTDRVKTSGDRLLGRRPVRALAPRKVSEARRTFRVPSATPGRRYYVIACADADRAVRESDESDNCRASSTTVSVLAAPAPADS